MSYAEINSEYRYLWIVFQNCVKKSVGNILAFNIDNAGLNTEIFKVKNRWQWC